MSDYILPELIVKILLKLPTRSLIRFTAVCKSWNCIITSPSFISSYLDKPQNQTNKPLLLLLLLQRYGRKLRYDIQPHYSLLEVVADHKPFTIISSAELDFPFKPPRFAIFDILGSCRGIVCLFSIHCFTKPIVLWNPCLRKHLLLPKGTIKGKIRFSFAVGFGVGDDHDDFKVVRLLYCCDGRRYMPEAEVFSLRTGEWRSLGVDVRFWNVNTARAQVLVNGAVHWLAYNAVGGDMIVVFRVAQEVFDEIKLPNELVMEHGGDLDLTLIGESLAVVMTQSNVEFGGESCDVWLMQAYGDESSWTRWCSYLKGEEEYVVALRKNGEVFVASQRSGLCVFDLENVARKSLGIHGVPWGFYVDDYVESLHLLREGQSEIAEE